VLTILGGLYDTRGGDAYEQVITGLTRVVPSA
jgi:hypothetical protein